MQRINNIFKKLLLQITQLIFSLAVKTGANEFLLQLADIAIKNGLLLCHRTLTSAEHAAYFDKQKSLAQDSGILMARMQPTLEESTSIVNTVTKEILPIFHRSVYWGDRLCSLDKAMAFWDEPRFRQLFEEFNGRHQYDQYSGPNGIAWRCATLAWAAKRALRLPGDFVECGVFKGDMSHFLVKLFDFGNIAKQFYLYDSFCGFDLSQTSAEDYPMNDNFLNFANAVYGDEQIYKTVRDKFAPYANVHITKGYLPDTLQEKSPEQIAYLHIDLNAPKPEIAVLEQLFPRMVSGGVIIFDDYGWVEFIQQRKAEDRFMKERGYEILELPTGQGLVIV